MPARKIPKNYLFVTGAYSSRKNGAMDSFESLLEKDYLLLLDFDAEVDSYEVQPVRIPVPGVPKGYVPDVLVKYRSEAGPSRPPLLVEVKHSEEVERNAQKYRPKFLAAESYAAERGWEFAVVDEAAIRTPRLANLKFLREYRNVEPEHEQISAVLQCSAWSAKSPTSETLLNALAPTPADRLAWLPIVWAMVIRRHLIADLDRPFTGEVPLALAGVNA
ncbi:MAG: TnsA endonuclease N-terminal domain-containing protein [Ramlibacter sp.]|nr:TnsA endonuclease N-terminal domain-containing protein [Ramlibacter sp.]MCW5651742.1 TnsA endonuclease N-terminal domain-containing protein [Ramlibacter sp.]